LILLLTASLVDNGLVGGKQAGVGEDERHGAREERHFCGAADVRTQSTQCGYKRV